MANDVFETPFDLSSARTAARSGSLDAWVDRYLRGPGRNPPFADGLRLRQRFWRGPLLLPLTRLRRKCGPEPGMQFPVSAESWAQRIAGIVATFVRLQDFPPLIVEYSGGDVVVCDGSHRLGAFASMGLPACWVIVWYPDRYQVTLHDTHAPDEAAAWRCHQHDLPVTG